MNKKKVVYVMTQMRHGGAERVCWLWLKNFDRKKYNVTLILFNRRGEYIDLLPKDIDIKVLGSNNLPSRIIELSLLFRSIKCDVVISMLYYTNLITIAAKIISFTKAQLVVSERNNFPQYLISEKFKFIKKNAVKILYPFADQVVCISKGVSNSLSFIKNDKRHVIYNPLDMALVDDQVNSLSPGPLPFSEPFVFSTLARFSPQKNHMLIVYAVENILKKGHSNFKVCFYGEGPEKSKIIDYVNRNSLDRFVKVYSFASDPYRILKKSYFSILSSDYEGFGNAIVDSFSVGTPVISTDCPSGPSEIISHGDDGLLFPVGSSEDLAFYMESVISGSIDRESMSKAATSKAEKFGVSVFIEQWDAVISING